MHALDIVVLLGVTVLVGSAVAARTGLLAPLVLLVVGAALSFVPGIGNVGLPSDAVLLLFLPALLYWESLTISLREIRANLRTIVLLSVGLVIATAASVAWIGHLVGLDWPMAFVLGAVLAPTDATVVSVVARRMPRRPLTVLRAESLINDGTALVLYAVAVDVATGRHPFSPIDVGWRLVVSYAGGIVVGLAVTGLVVLVRRVIPDPPLANMLSIITPFLAYLPAERLNVSGVVSVVICGLILAHRGPRIVTAASRTQASAFWTLATFVLNGALFVLVGLQVNSVLDGLQLSFGRACVAAVACYLAVLGTRVVWSNTTPYIVRALDRRPSQRARRVGWRQRVPSTWAGFRGAVSLAAALAIPTTRVDGTSLAGRDVILFATIAVIVLALAIQGTTLPRVIAWAHLESDGAEHDELHLAKMTATRAAADALPGLARGLDVDQHIADRVGSEYAERLRMVDGNAADDDLDEARARADAERRLRQALISEKRNAVLDLSAQNRIDDAVLRTVQSQLDAEELRLDGRDPRNLRIE